MTLRLTLLSSPVPQPRDEFRLESGRAVLGRDEGCDWRLEDPEMFVSRRHCLIEASAAGWTVTDTSTGGLFLDMATRPLGSGGHADLRDGMRLRLGDVVLGVEMRPAAQSTARAAPDPGLGLDPFFAPHDTPPAPPPRPEDLPEPFERTTGRAVPAAPAPPPGFDDPFTLDALPRSSPAPAIGMDWNWGPAVQPETQPPPPDPPPAAAIVADIPPRVPDDDSLAAFLRGAGLDGATGVDPETAGRHYRMLVLGLVALLRSRADEKDQLRLAQTTLGAAMVNPLKFLAMADEQLLATLTPRGAGYLGPDAAIAEALHDLADHRLRSWHGLQVALRQMIDRFAPQAIEAELTAAGPLRTLLAGGHATRLWQVYEQRWADIARAAEDRFLGEIGADFRDAYESTDRRET